jgi:hypothetical protein
LISTRLPFFDLAAPQETSNRRRIAFSKTALMKIKIEEKKALEFVSRIYQRSA